MKYFIGIMLFFLSSLSFAGDKEDFLSAWEGVQKNHKEVASFERLEKGKYKIKFVNLPYEGELTVLTYDVEELNLGTRKDALYTKSGYIEIDLPGAPENISVKYGRTYYKWFESNTLYLNNETGEWHTGKEYSKALFEDNGGSAGGGWLSYIFEYWDYLFAAFILYLIISSIVYGKRANDLVKVQNAAAEDAKKIMAVQDEAIELHKETNKILVGIFEELKKDR